MKILKITILVLLTLQLPLTSHANESSCKIDRPQDLIQCALSRHPDLQRAQNDLEQAAELRSAAAQLPNPDLDFSVVRGRSLGDVILEYELSLGFNVELGGKRSSRIEKANALKAVSDGELLVTKEDVIIRTVIALFRTKHLLEELATVEEALSTFDRIQKQYSSRVKLNPEQEVSLGVFQLARSEYQLQKRALLQEKEALEEFFQLATESSVEDISKVISQLGASWPDVQPSQKELISPLYQLAKANLLSAEAELSLAQSQSWPDLKIGPIVQYNAEGGVSYPAYGLGVSLPLPLFSLNGGGRAYASKGLMSAERNLHLVKTENAQRRSRLLSVYRSSVDALRETLSSERIEKKHKNIESLFFRGLISSPLVIEAHRQILDVMKSQNEQEIRAAESLWKIYAIEGRILKEELQ